MLRNCDAPDRDLVFAAEKGGREPDDDLFKMQTNDLQIWKIQRKEMEVEGRRIDYSKPHGDTGQ